MHCQTVRPRSRKYNFICVEIDYIVYIWSSLDVLNLILQYYITWLFCAVACENNCWELTWPSSIAVSILIANFHLLGNMQLHIDKYLITEHFNPSALDLWIVDKDLWHCQQCNLRQLQSLTQQFWFEPCSYCSNLGLAETYMATV